MTERVATQDPPTTDNLPGITEISVGGFKSIRDEQRIAIRPLTLLAGANSSGKSSIMQPLLLLKQTLEAPYDPGPLLLNGPNVRFTSADQFLTRQEKLVDDMFYIELTDKLLGSLRLYFERKAGKRLRPMLLVASNGEVSEIDPDMSLNDVMQSLPERLKKVIPNDMFNLFHYDIIRERCFLKIELFWIDENEGQTEVYEPYKGFDERISQIIHVPGLRGNPERAYTVAAVGDKFIGTFENYTASVIDTWQEDAAHNKLASLRLDLERLGLTQQIKANRINDAQVQLQVGRLLRSLNDRSEDLVDISDVGLGVSQTLPVIVALHAAQPGQLVYIEQPELHLHPRAQSAMARVLADAALRGVRVVAETHSNLLLLGVQTLVAEGHLPPDLVKLHWFQRGEDGATKVTSADLDETGAYGNWPEDFADVILDAEGRYLDAASARLMSA